MIIKYLLLMLYMGLSVGLNATATANERLSASEFTKQANQALADQLDLKDSRDLKDASRGFIAGIEGDVIKNPNGRVAVDANEYDFMDDERPDTVNASLWRHGLNARVHGLFKVVDGIYQFRGYDGAVMTFIEGETGWIIIDPLLTSTTSRVAKALIDEKVGKRDIATVLYTHSHQDHFGGVRGILTDQQIADKSIPIIAPPNFAREVIAEHLLAGTYMHRRVWYQVGGPLVAAPDQRMGVGLSQSMAFGPMDIVMPTQEIKEGGETLTVDGIELVLMDASGSEATSEFVLYLPKFRALHTAEVVTGTQHNLLTPRGAIVRDALFWSEVIDKMLMLFGAQSDVMMGSHNWPVFGREHVQEKLRNNRNVYRYIHDQTLRQANSGYTMHEIAAQTPEPKAMQYDFSTRSYYGDFKHNLRAVFQRYFGWWDAVPANLNPLPPEIQSKKYVELAGGETAILQKGKAAFNEGDYQWAATLLNHLVFANPENTDGRLALASVYQQLGYQSESAVLRNFYLTGAHDLRILQKESEAIATLLHLNTPKGLPIKSLGDVIAVHFNPAKFDHKPYILQVNLQDRNETLWLDIGPDVVFPRAEVIPNSHFEININEDTLTQFIDKKIAAKDLTQDAKAIKALTALQDALEAPNTGFNIVEP